ncbi:MAG: ATP phosphoribosyltransferase regulatory subunit [Candidatus Pacearchaeota archaeon]
MTTEPVKGFKDSKGKEAEKREEIQKIIRETFEKYGYEPAETPVIEHEEFVKGDNQEDEAVSDIFKLKDRGNRKLALRYEFTFQLKRLMENQKLPYKRYQIGPIFRDEPAGPNRFRQFLQCDADVVGSTIKDEAEVLALNKEILSKCGITPRVLINNRKLLNEILDDNEVKEKNKDQVLREVDKYDKLTEEELRKNLKKLKAESVLDSLKKGNSYFKKFESYQEILDLSEYCKAYGFEVKFSSAVVRGLSYYNGTVFEIEAKGIDKTIVAGGSFMFNNTQCTGISFGVDRISSVANVETQKEKYLVVSLNQDKEAIKIAQDLRKSGKIATLYFGKPSKALAYANSKEISKTLFVGAEEVKKKKFKLKNMKTGEEKPVTLQQIKKKNVLFSKKSGK